jgi:hypothetical protein
MKSKSCTENMSPVSRDMEISWLLGCEIRASHTLVLNNAYIKKNSRKNVSHKYYYPTFPLYLGHLVLFLL